LHSVGRALAHIVGWWLEHCFPFPIDGMCHASPVVAPDPDFDARWAAWVERGRAHEQHVRDWFVIWAGSLTTGAVIVHALLRL